MKKSIHSAVWAMAFFASVVAIPLAAEGELAVIGGSGGGVHAFVGFEHEIGRVVLGDFYLRESVGGSYVHDKAVVSPDLLFGWQLFDSKFLRLDANLSCGAHIVPQAGLSYLSYASAGAEISSWLLFAGYEFVVAIPDFKDVKPQYLHQLSAGLRLKLGKAAKARPMGPAAKPLPTVKPQAGQKAKALSIVINSPKLQSGKKFVTTEASILVSGRVSEPGSAKELRIQGKKSELGKKGEFSAKLQLPIGDTTIVVTAIDLANKKYETTMVVQRKKK